MARTKQERKHLSKAEWDALPVTFEGDDASRVYCASWRWTIDHAEELGGRKIAGRWVFSKSAVAKILGIEA